MPTVRLSKLLCRLLLLSAALPPLNAIGTNTTIPELQICYDFGCRSKETIRIEESEWQSIVGWFQPPAVTATIERKQIRQAIGWMEEIVGRYTPTYRDKALNLEHGGQFPGQMDCLDESHNIGHYLSVFESLGFLRHHGVVQPAYRRTIFDDHWASQIEERATGTRFVVDGWFQDNGYLPLIEPTQEWLSLSFFRLLPMSLDTD